MLARRAALSAAYWNTRAQAPIILKRPNTASACAMGKANLGATTRALHWVFKVADRTSTVKFYTDVLGLTPLRHEEFDEACAAACNGPYDNRWSKTMIGYGPEDDQFVLELTYNYPIKSYELGNDFRHIVVRNRAAYARAVQHDSAKPTADAGTPSAPATLVTAPGGYPFLVVDEDVPSGTTAMTELCLSSSDLPASLAFWHGFLGFTLVSGGPGQADAVLSPGPGQATLRLVALQPSELPLRRGTAYGRVAFAVEGGLLQALEADVKAAGYTVQTPYVSLDTPGKATVQVVILQDPDGHEICFVGDEGFRDLSQPDPAAQQLLQDAISQDGSEAWLARRAKQLAEMLAKGV